MQFSKPLIILSFVVCAALSGVAAAPAPNGAQPKKEAPKKEKAYIVDDVVSAYVPVTIPEDVDNGKYGADWYDACENVTTKYRAQGNVKEEGGWTGKWASVVCIARVHGPDGKEVFWNYSKVLAQQMGLTTGHHRSAKPKPKAQPKHQKPKPKHGDHP